jgi:cysteine desulfurase
MNEQQIYLDYAATTPLDSRVLDRMIPYFSTEFGNPSSTHRYGQRAEHAVETARSDISKILGCKPSEVIFTACGSESDNLALQGLAFASRQNGKNHILVTPVEHHAVVRTAQRLEQTHSFELEFLPVDKFGRVSVDDLEAHIRSDTALVSIIYANNEIGSINPIPELSDVCHRRGVPFHTDAVQAASQLSMDVKQLGADLLSLGAHKFYGPKGVGALYIREGIPLHPLLHGGSQEFGRRPGTHNVPLIVGMAEALAITQDELQHHNQLFLRLRDRLIDEVLHTIPDVRLTGHSTERLPNHASFAFLAVDGNQLIAALDLAGYACSSGSACKTGDPEPSEVLLSLGLSRDWALGSLRITFGRHSKESDIDSVMGSLTKILPRLR